MVDTSTSNEQPIEYISFAGRQDEKTLSRAEEAAIQRRVRVYGYSTSYYTSPLLCHSCIKSKRLPTNPKRVRKQDLIYRKKYDTSHLAHLSLTLLLACDHIRQVLKSTQPSVSKEESFVWRYIKNLIISDVSRVRLWYSPSH